jgi:rod shape-determining protein MreC
VAIGGERYGSRADTVAFVVCLVLSLVTLALPAGIRAPVAGTLRRTVLLPFEAAEAEAVDARERRENLAALRAQRDSLALAAARLPSVEAENTQLRALLRLRGRLRFGFVPAEVLRQTGPTDGLTLLLSAGRDAGIVRYSAVVAPSGLVGTVIAVDPHSSVAMTWTHPDFRASGMVGRGQVYGIVSARRSGSAGEVMALTGVPYGDSLRPGTPVVTSGLGGVFPRGIPIGTVVGQASAAEQWERTFLLRPAASLARVSHVLILSPHLATDTLTEAFDTVPPAAPALVRAPIRPAPVRVAPAGSTRVAAPPRRLPAPAPPPAQRPDTL